jgi:hypothetical protein
MLLSYSQACAIPSLSLTRLMEALQLRLYFSMAGRPAEGGSHGFSKSPSSKRLFFFVGMVRANAKYTIF